VADPAPALLAITASALDRVRDFRATAPDPNDRVLYVRVTGEADGTLLLHGKSKSIRFKYTAQHEGVRIKVEGGMRIDIRDFGMAVPEYLGLKVKPEVDAA